MHVFDDTHSSFFLYDFVTKKKRQERRNGYSSLIDTPIIILSFFPQYQMINLKTSILIKQSHTKLFLFFF